MKKVAVIIGALILFFLFIKIVFATTFPKTICHHTPANQVSLTFQNQQSYNGHLGQPHNNQTFDTNGACANPSPTPTPSPLPSPSSSPSPSVSPSPSPEPELCDDQSALNYEEEGTCEYGGGLPPSPVPLTQGAEGCSQNCSPSYNPPSCNGIYADKPVFTGISRVSPTEVQVNWATNNSDKIDISYGYVGGALEFGVTGLPGDARQKDLGLLADNTPINVQITAWRGNCSIQSEIVDP